MVTRYHVTGTWHDKNSYNTPSLKGFEIILEIMLNIIMKLEGHIGWLFIKYKMNFINTLINEQ